VGNSNPKVIIIGKGKGKIAADAQQLISTISPSTVPLDMVEGIIVETQDGSRYKIDHTYLTEGLEYAKIEKHLKNIGIGAPVTSVEILVDLVKTKLFVDAQTKSLLDNYFEPED